MGGKARHAKHPYSREEMVKRGRAGAEKRWAKKRQEDEQILQTGLSSEN